MGTDQDDFEVVDVARYPGNLRADAVIYSDVSNLDNLREAISNLIDSVGEKKSGAMQGALVLPVGTHLYQHKADLKEAAGHGIFSIVRSESDRHANAGGLVRKSFTVDEPAIQDSKSWIEDLQEFRKNLPPPTGFEKDPDLDAYFN